jgi:hypothetical protein
MLKNGTAPVAAFSTEQKSVLAIQQKGIAIRETNQKLAKEINSPAIAGLAIVAGAQVKEMMQVTEGYGGGCGYAHHAGAGGAGRNQAEPEEPGGSKIAKMCELKREGSRPEV